MITKSIEVTVYYLDDDGNEAVTRRTSETFEGAEENLGKLERAFNE